MVIFILYPTRTRKIVRMGWTWSNI